RVLPGGVGVVAMRRAERREGRAVHGAGHVARRRQAERLVEARDTEALRVSAADRHLGDRRELRADLRREARLTRRVIVVTAREVQLEHVDDRSVDFEEARPDAARTLGADRVDRVIAIILVAQGARVAAMRVDRLFAIDAADRDLQRTARKLRSEERRVGEGGSVRTRPYR